jgi:hypothetical protein
MSDSTPSQEKDVQSAPRDAEALLRATLERLVILECRNTLSPEARTPQANLQGGSPPQLRDQEILQQELRTARSRAEAAEHQRDRLFAQVLEAERLHSSLSESDGGGGEVDLASFISELRSELAEVQRARELADQRNAELSTQLRQVQAGKNARSATAWAARLRAEGLLFREDAPLAELWPDLCAGTSSEQLVLAGVVRDLDSTDVPLRESACIRLEGLPPALAAPVVATSLGREKDSLLLCRLLRIGGRLGVKSLLPLVERELDHGDERVRAAALLAALRLNANPQALDRWLSDASPRVRRSAAIAVALRLPERAQPMLEQLALDPEPNVRKLATACAAALAAPPEQILRRMGNDEDTGVRRSALRALQASPEIAGLAAAERRKRLKAQPVPQRRSEQPRKPAGHPSTSVADDADPGFDVLPTLERELRASLRGRTIEELAQLLDLPGRAVERSVERGVSEGRLVRRGAKLYVG